MAGLEGTSLPAAAAAADTEGVAERWLMRLALVSSFLLLALRLHVARHTGFGDAEALYACYALHPQPAYLDHPGLVGTVAGWLGSGRAPSPNAAHLFAALLATAVPWLGALAARFAGAVRVGCLSTALALTWTPELAIGLLALTPDLLLAVLWLGALGLAALALRSDPKSFRALIATLGAGALVGLAFLAKISGALLGVAFLCAMFTRAARPRLRTFAPWGALLLGLLLASPVILWETRNGWPMLTHRLVSTQAGAGFSLRNFGGLIGGQLAYVSPPFLFGAALLLRDLFRERNADSTARLLFLATVVPGVPLILLCLWSRVAEPHWLAPAYLPLAIHLGRRAVIGRALAFASIVTGVVVAIVAWLWVMTPLPIHALGSAYRARYDLANDLHAWGPGRRLLQQSVAEARLEAQKIPVVVGPHYIVCAQAEAALGGQVPVGCNSPIRDDFDAWYPRERWLEAPVVLYVQDSRFEVDPMAELPGRVVRSVTTADVRRGGVVVRTIRITRLDKLSGVGSAPELRRPRAAAAVGPPP
jgi:hypothetical protein